MIDKAYILKHWTLTLVIAPFLPAIYEGLFLLERGWAKTLELYPLFLIFSFVFSLPALLVYFLLFQVLAKENINPLTMKLVLIGFAVISIALTCWSIKGSMMPVLATSYSISVVFTGLICKLRTGEVQPTTPASRNGS
jgi:hypothetical protein